MQEFRLEYHKDSRTGKEFVRDYIRALRPNERGKIYRTTELLRERGRLPEPYCKHIDGKMWELRIQFSPFAHRILYVVIEHKTIILLHAFTKKTDKLPARELTRAWNKYKDVLDNLNYYYEKTD